MNCQEVMELMQRQLDGDLDAQEEEELHVHLMDCLDCAEMFERLQRLSDELNQLPKVVPPYSLVDAILPQLGEMDRLAAASITEPTAAFSMTTETPTRSQPPQLPWTRRFGSQFSWKLASGVVAAGLIIGFFAFNMKQPMLDQADGLLQPSTQSESTSMAQSAPVSGLTTGAEEKKPTIKDTETQPSSPVSDGKQEKVEPSAVSAPVATTDAKLEKPQAIDQTAASTNKPKDAISSKMAPSTSEPERLKDPRSFGTEVNVPELKPSDSEISNKATEVPKEAISAKTAEPSSSPTPLLKKADPQEGSDKADMYSLMVGPTDPILKSVSGTFEAVVEEQHVVIRDSSSQEIVFASKQIWQQSDEINLVEWSKDDKLSYQVLSGDSSKTFVVDMKTKKEIVP
ncbi:hypothetical protein GK047_03870 [Paenibacillus sp. SYP-B3998]|uniref:Anti-sigma-W factor RsiW n=1 Tax=Paenibacillus sp. SYP-B3998 TaxID=2678564 RepID=A0A6G3ZUR3_9BACL|nr:zf-HC2 domain-containing protein [Paenibacillus sp. SYP-B3998]NEW05157.1 hypothetical protein [Paenibacillus sp. SYP-B3998]